MANASGTRPPMVVMPSEIGSIPVEVTVAVSGADVWPTGTSPNDSNDGAIVADEVMTPVRDNGTSRWVATVSSGITRVAWLNPDDIGCGVISTVQVSP